MIFKRIKRSYRNHAVHVGVTQTFVQQCVTAIVTSYRMWEKRLALSQLFLRMLHVLRCGVSIQVLDNNLVHSFPEACYSETKL
jgi:hypothetical protein